MKPQPHSFRWIDPLGMYHIDANNWAFIDGHVETHKWKDKAAIAAGLHAAKGANMSGGFPAATSGYDYNYIRLRCAVSRLALTGGLVSFSAVL
jgi:prepilin-type processing-associated H-X9-DG protein